jgi:hypothetical protein
MSCMWPFPWKKWSQNKKPTGQLSLAVGFTAYSSSLGKS